MLVSLLDPVFVCFDEESAYAAFSVGFRFRVKRAGEVDAGVEGDTGGMVVAGTGAGTWSVGSGTGARNGPCTGGMNDVGGDVEMGIGGVDL